MSEATYHFPPDFKWGVATASHQVEGNNTNNQWWAWEQTPGRIAAGQTSGPACDWWHRAEADFDRAAEMNLTTLRLSIEWSRVEVAPGRIDTAALRRYREMLQGLRDRGIEPMVTLHHFSDPLWLAEKGGWASPDAVTYFTRYVEQVVEALRPYTDLWCTINEPNVYASLGYITGEFPPGVRDLRQAGGVLRNMLRAHAAAYQVIHRMQEGARVGLAHNVRFFDPAPRTARAPRTRKASPHRTRLVDRLAARLHDFWFNQTTLMALNNGWWLPPLGFGPALGLRNTLDWIGLNYYTRDLIAFDRHGDGLDKFRTMHSEDAEPLDGGYGELYPEGLARAVKRLARCDLPIHITENGIPDADDDQRPRALLLHLHQLWHVLQENTGVVSYYHWTLVDNFEWAQGWTLPFGLIELDPESQKRTPRPSADLYAAIARGNAITPELLDAYAPELRPVLLPG